MSFHDTTLSTHSRPRKRIRHTVDVEVILEERSKHYLVVRSDETSDRRTLERSGVKILAEDGQIATLEMQEHLAISLGLI